MKRVQTKNTQKVILLFYLTEKIFLLGYNAGEMAEHDTKKVTEEFLKFGDAMIEKMKFHCSQKQQSIRMLRKY